MQLKLKSYRKNKGLYLSVAVSGSVLDYVKTHLQKSTAFIANCSISRCFCPCFTRKGFCNAVFLLQNPFNNIGDLKKLEGEMFWWHTVAAGFRNVFRFDRLELFAN